MLYESFALPQFFNRSLPLCVLRLVLDFFWVSVFCMSVGIFCLFQVGFFLVDLLACEVVGCTSVVLLMIMKMFLKTKNK